MSIDAGIQWFSGLGFRPAVWTASHRADGVDPQRLAVAPDADVALIGKFDPFAHIPSEGYAWGTWIPASPAPQITAASLAGPTPVPVPVYGNPQPSPWWPTDPWGPDYPCQCITTPPVNPPLPEPAPVPLPASAGLLLVAIAILFIIRRKSCN